jgi:hypothetical protein
MARRSSGVNSQMPRGGSVGLKGNPGHYDAMAPPFDHPHSLGNGGIPVKICEDMGETSVRGSKTPGDSGAFSSGANNNDYKNERPVKRMPPPRG